MPTLEEGQTFERYAVTRWLGSGVSGESYEAKDVTLQQKVTLKLIHPWAVLGDSARRQFFREMQGIGRLSHPYLAAVLDYGEVNGRLYVARRYASSGSLLGSEGRLWFHPPLSISDAIVYGHQLAQALEHIHSQGCLHGALTFANILVLRGPNVESEPDYAPFLLADVGLANFVRRFGQPPITLLPITAAPEQLGKRVTPASDQFALAVLIFTWLAGRPPYLGSPEEVEQLKLSETIAPLCALNPEVTEEQEAVLRHALAVYPDERYPSVLAFAGALLATLTPQPQTDSLAEPDTPVELTTQPEPSPESTPVPESVPAQDVPTPLLESSPILEPDVFTSLPELSPTFELLLEHTPALESAPAHEALTPLPELAPMQDVLISEPSPTFELLLGLLQESNAAPTPDVPEATQATPYPTPAPTEHFSAGTDTPEPTEHSAVGTGIPELRSIAETEPVAEQEPSVTQEQVSPLAEAESVAEQEPSIKLEPALPLAESEPSAEGEPSITQEPASLLQAEFLLPAEAEPSAEQESSIHQEPASPWQAEFLPPAGAELPVEEEPPISQELTLLLQTESWPLAEAELPVEEEPSVNSEPVLPLQADASLSMPVCFIINSPYTQEPVEVMLQGDEITLGRAGASDILLDYDALTSRHHALLRHEGGHYVIYDRRSVSGVFVNGQKLTGDAGYALVDGDHIRIGNYELIFRSSEQSSVH